MKISQKNTSVLHSTSADDIAMYISKLCFSKIFGLEVLDSGGRSRTHNSPTSVFEWRFGTKRKADERHFIVSRRFSVNMRSERERWKAMAWSMTILFGNVGI
jgi:hypothetical protein